MANLDNLGYNTYVLRTIRSVIECKKILVYNKNSFINDSSIGRINLYNLEDIYSRIKNDSRCYPITRTLTDPDDYREVPFEYDCSNIYTNGFDVIIYVGNDDNPAGYTEFVNIQGRVSDYIRIYLYFEIDKNKITLELNNSLWRIRDTIPNKFIGKELNKFPSSQEVIDGILNIPKDQKYTSHLSEFLRPTNTSGIFLGSRTVLPSGSIVGIDFVKDINILDGEEYSNYQIGYYQDDIVLYSWIYLDDEIGYYYRITSLITQETYKHTVRVGYNVQDTIGRYNTSEISKDLLYCSGKYLVFRINYQTGRSEIKLFDTTLDSWVSTKEPNVIVDPLDKTSKIYEIPKAQDIQSINTILDIIPEVSDIYLDLNSYIQLRRSLDLVKKIGDWFVLKILQNNSTLYLFSCPSMSVYMSSDEYNKCIVINNNTLMILGENYYTVYHGPKKKIYYTEKAKCIVGNNILIDVDFFGDTIKMCNDENLEEYLNYYKKSEISIVLKNKPIYETILNSYRRQLLYSYEVPNNIIGAFGGIIFYMNQYNNINYI